MALNFRTFPSGGLGLTPRSTDPTSPAPGDLQLADGTIRAKGLWQYIDTSWQQVGSSSSGSAINYITGGNAESGISSFVTYADAANAIPVDGTGGSANITFAVSATTPLRGINSYILTKDAVNRLGQGASSVFTIDGADRNQVLTVSADYAILSGTFATGDVSVYVYDVTNAAVIQPAGFQVQNILGSGRIVSTFQTTTSTSYRLIFHVASVSASAYVLQLENISISPQVVVYGAAVFDYPNQASIITAVSSSPNFSAGFTVNTVACTRSGSYADIEVDLIQPAGGSTGTGVYLFTLPHSLVLDTSRKNASTTTTVDINNNTGFLGSGIIIKPSAGSGTIAAYAYNTTQYYLVFTALTNDSSQVTPTSNQSIQDPFSSVSLLNFSHELSVQFKLRVPILGWSASVQMSDSADTRVVAANATLAAQQTISSSAVTRILLDTAAIDTHSMLSSNRLTIRVPGLYTGFGKINTANMSSGQRIIASVHKNGVTRYSSSEIHAASDDPTIIVPFMDNLIAGDYLELFVQSDDGSYTILNGNTTTLSLHRLSGPSAIAASETMTARYTANTGQTLTNSAITRIDFTTRDYDSHGSVATGASWAFTANISGEFEINCNVGIQSFATGAAVNLRLFLYKDTVNTQNIGYMRAANETTIREISGKGIIKLLAGERINVRFENNSATNALVDTSGAITWISIKRTGNY